MIDPKWLKEQEKKWPNVKPDLYWWEVRRCIREETPVAKMHWEFESTYRIIFNHFKDNC